MAPSQDDSVNNQIYRPHTVDVDTTVQETAQHPRHVHGIYVWDPPTTQEPDKRALDLGPSFGFLWPGMQVAFLFLTDGIALVSK